jgi:hypothetical protein
LDEIYKFFRKERFSAGMKQSFFCCIPYLYANDQRMKIYKVIFSLCCFFLLTGVLLAQEKPRKPMNPKYPGYDYVGSFNNGLAKVKKNKKWGYIDTTGNVVVQPMYNEVENFSDGLARVRQGQKWGLIGKDGTLIIKPTFDWIYEFIDGIAKVKIDGQEYYMNTSGQRVVPK